MKLKQQVIRRLVRQFHHPTGLGGTLAGWVMSHRPSNVQRNRWAVDLLDVQPDDRVLELGCGPGVAVAALAQRASNGLVVGIDHSEVMINQARRRNAPTVAAGRVRLVHASVECLPAVDRPFDAALAVNNAGIWPAPVERLREIATLLRTGGRIALVSQPRHKGEPMAAAGDLAKLLTDAGFENLRIEKLALEPPVVCVLGVSPH